MHRKRVKNRPASRSPDPGRGRLAAAATLAVSLALTAVQDSHAGTDGPGREGLRTADIVELARAWLEVFPQGEFDAFPGEVSPDFLLRLPFVPEGVPGEFRGRETARAALAGSARGRSRLVFSEVVIRRTEDPDLVVITARGQAELDSGETYCNEYIMLTRIRDGVVIEHVEYFNPLAVTQSMAARAARGAMSGETRRERLR